MMKFAAAILTVLALLGTGWVIVAVSRPMPAMPPTAGVSPELSQQLKTGEAELQHLRALDKTLDQINRLALAARPAAAVLALHDSKAQDAALGKGSAQPADPVISLVYVSTDLKKVVIDGKLLGAGDQLPGGGRLISITQERIEYERKGRRATMRLPKPDVLGSAPNPGNPNQGQLQ